MAKRMDRRHFLWLAAATGGASVLAACAPVTQQPVTEGAPAAPAAAEQAPVTLIHWQHHSDSRSQVVEQFKARFEDENPNVTIDFQSIPWSDYWGKLASGIAAGAGSAPDVFQIPMGLVEEYVAGGSLVPISDLVMSAADIEATYLPWTVQRAKADGKYFGLPLDVQTLVMYCNNELFEEAGLDPTEPFLDHADFAEKARLLTKKTGDEFDQVGCDVSYYCVWLTTLFQQFLQREKGGIPWVDPATNKLVYNDYPEIFDVFSWYVELSADVFDVAFMSGQDRFALGRAAINLSHPVYRGSLKMLAPDLAYTVNPFPPRSVGQELYTAGSHWMWVVGKWAPDYETAWNWVNYCTNKPAQIVWSDVGGDLPSHQGLVDDPRFRKDANAEVCMDSLKYASPWEWIGWAEWVKEFGDAHDRVVIGNEDARQSFNTMIENLNVVVETHTVRG